MTQENTKNNEVKKEEKQEKPELQILNEKVRMDFED